MNGGSRSRSPATSCNSSSTQPQTTILGSTPPRHSQESSPTRRARGSSAGDQSARMRVTSVRMLRQFDDWASAVAIVGRVPAPSARAVGDRLDIYVLTLLRQPDDRWLVADVALR